MNTSKTNNFATHVPSWLGGRPQDVGIVAMDVYFPSMYVSQQDLEAYDGVSQGNEYTRFDFSPESRDTNLFPGTFFLDRVDSLERRYYAQKRAMHTCAAAVAAVPRALPTTACAQRTVYPAARTLMSLTTLGRRLLRR
ncbi:hypothetical protein PTSG_05313 [Salpingoeca rosetta]|uniref:Hydroxymethylglutaryl-coenzyme A synthase N-terminal domain-containing protein n=1 Tax=Salpingoeca rosetta (strain ATCC 50818 / BSB-021) TaxID=946362 RepID=F2UA28_SALR5|nr:uncharacterized protein PTSG_05313 [Salpingoeca rosetta]EGD73603.1 hypothetical protein PTSG_05313 [Salpingoeca rosetta]|eukprot:XP_004993885.1 hypothetical protein PTSG_05313 [Salpingoeca rosetta]